MRFTSAIVASVLTFGALLGGLAVSADNDAAQKVQHRAVASALPADPVVRKAENDHGNV